MGGDTVFKIWYETEECYGNIEKWTDVYDIEWHYMEERSVKPCNI